MAFHNVRFPSEIARGATVGPERRTDVVVLGSGHEERNSRWADSRRRYNAGYGIKSLDDLYDVITFFEERRGRLHGFLWRDHSDFKSCSPQGTVSPLDQVIGTGDGATDTFQLIKQYGSGFSPWVREIAKPVAGTVQIAVAGVVRSEGSHFSVDADSGRITFLAGHIPAIGTTVSAGFEFDVPVRFDTDKLDINLSGFQHGAIPSVPIVEIRL